MYPDWEAWEDAAGCTRAGGWQPPRAAWHSPPGPPPQGGQHLRPLAFPLLLPPCPGVWAGPASSSAPPNAQDWALCGLWERWGGIKHLSWGWRLWGPLKEELRR